MGLLSFCVPYYTTSLTNEVLVASLLSVSPRSTLKEPLKHNKYIPEQGLPAMILCSMYNLSESIVDNLYLIVLLLLFSIWHSVNSPNLRFVNISRSAAFLSRHTRRLLRKRPAKLCNVGILCVPPLVNYGHGNKEPPLPFLANAFLFLYWNSLMKES